MPTYDYICKDCGHTFEVFQSMFDPTIKECPSCNGHVRRIVSGGTGLIFKGTGYYETDYKNNGKTSSKEKSETKKETTKNEKKDKDKD